MLTEDETRQVYTAGFNEGWECAVMEMSKKLANMRKKSFSVTVTASGEDVEEKE